MRTSPLHPDDEKGRLAALRRYDTAHRNETRLFFLGAEAVMRLYAAGDSLPARFLRDAALRLGNLPPLRQALTARMRDPDLGGPGGGAAGRQGP